MIRWRLWAQRPAAAAAAAWPRLWVHGRGMCSAVGHSSDAACAALRARMNHFRETDFLADGEPMIGAALFDEPSWGVERLRGMLQAVVSECLGPHTTPGHDRIAILVLCAQPQRPGMPVDGLDDALAELVDGSVPGWGPFHGQSRLCPYGKAGVGQLLEEAASLLSGPQAPKRVLVVGVDSLLDAGAVEHFLEHERIATRRNSDGFVPGEAAAAVLLGLEPPGHAALAIDGVGRAVDPWRIGSDQAQRGTALTQAMRQAAGQAGLPLASLDFHASGMTGEAWYAKEMNLALSRALEARVPDLIHLAVARQAGETGAASPVLTLAWLAGEMGRADGPGPCGMLHMAEDDGQRAAVMLRWQQA